MPLSESNFLSSYFFQIFAVVIIITLGAIMVTKKKKLGLFFRFIYNLVIGIDPGKDGKC